MGVTVVLMLLQSVLLSVIVNALALTLPLQAAILCGCIALLIGTATLPHYLFGQREVKLFLVCYGHDIAQISAAVSAIFIAGLV